MKFPDGTMYFYAIAIAFLAASALFYAAAYARARKRLQNLERQFQQAVADLAERDATLREREQLDDLKDEFISTVSHELRTPLTSIRGALGLLSAGMMGTLDDKGANLLRIASANTDRLVRLINDILDLERMDSGRAPMVFRPCSLRELILQAVETMRPLADAAHVRMEIVPEPGGMPPVFAGDPDRIQQVLVNLLSNAIKFSPSDTSVLVRSGFTESSLYLRVEDAGRGVPAEKLESIFDRFNQVESSDARQKGGTGLGLAICRTILAQHGGSIWAERNDANGSFAAGTTFIVELPRVNDAPKFQAA